MRVDAGTGLKKCRPRKFPGRCSSLASPFTDSEDVFDARYASGASRSSIPRSDATFKSQSSGTASTTSCRSLNAS